MKLRCNLLHQWKISISPGPMASCDSSVCCKTDWWVMLRHGHNAMHEQAVGCPPRKSCCCLLLITCPFSKLAIGANALGQMVRTYHEQQHRRRLLSQVWTQHDATLACSCLLWRSALVIPLWRHCLAPGKSSSLRNCIQKF